MLQAEHAKSDVKHLKVRYITLHERGGERANAGLRIEGGEYNAVSHNRCMPKERDRSGIHQLQDSPVFGRHRPEWIDPATVHRVAHDDQVGGWWRIEEQAIHHNVVQARFESDTGWLERSRIEGEA